MAARTLDLLINVQGNALVSSFTSTAQAGIPGFVFGDSTPVSVRLVEPSGVPARPWREIDLTGQSVRIGIGVPGSAPTAGTFTLTYGGDTTAALAYNASAAQIAAALNALASITSAGGITVTATASAFKVIFDDVGVRTALTASTASLSPTSSAYISTVLEGSVSAQAIYLVKLEAQPAAYEELADDLAVAALTATTVREGGTGIADIQSFTLDPIPYDGTYTLTVDTEETASLAYNATAAQIQSALEALASIGAGNVTVSGDFPAYTVTFDPSLGDVGDITGDVSALTVPTGRKGTLSNNTTGIAELLSSRAFISATLEVEIVDDISGETWTPLQAACTIREDVIPNTPASSTEGPVYLLESVANSRYITNEAHDIGNFENAEGAYVLDRANGSRQYGMMIGNTTIAAPDNFEEGQCLTLSFFTNGGEWDLDFNGIEMSAEAEAALPVTLPNSKAYIIELQMTGFLPVLTAFHGPTNVD